MSYFLAIEYTVSPLTTLCDTPVTGKICRVWPGFILSFGPMEFCHKIVSVITPNFSAIELAVSPSVTVYSIVLSLGLADMSVEIPVSAVAVVSTDEGD